MLIKASNVIGLKVVSLDKGETIDEVEDVIYDAKAEKVIAFLINQGGWSASAQVIPFAEVINIGEDALTIKNRESIKKASDVKGMTAGISASNVNLQKMTVLTKSGSNLGKVSDVVFDEKNGSVHELEISGGPIQDLRFGRKKLPVSDIENVGVNNIIVNSTSEGKDRKEKNNGRNN